MVNGRCFVFLFKQKTAYEITEGDWSSDVCSSDLDDHVEARGPVRQHLAPPRIPTTVSEAGMPQHAKPREREYGTFVQHDDVAVALGKAAKKLVQGVKADELLRLLPREPPGCSDE